MTVRNNERFTRRNPCPICGGHKEMAQGRGVRCCGMYGSDGKIAMCSRVPSGSTTRETASGYLYIHVLEGTCNCGQPHHSAGRVVVSIHQPEPEWIALAPVPDWAARPTFWRKDGRRPSKVWPYLDAQGRVIQYRARIETEDGGKEVFPYSFCEHIEQPHRWMWKDLPRGRRPLYGLEILAARPDDPVLIVEGEKTADAGRILYPQRVVMTWAGGTHGTPYIDWAPLKGRECIFFPDSDDPEPEKGYPDGKGVWAMQQAAQHALKSGARSARLVPIPEGWPRGGYDLADYLEETMEAAQ